LFLFAEIINLDVLTDFFPFVEIFFVEYFTKLKSGYFMPNNNWDVPTFDTDDKMKFPSFLEFEKNYKKNLKIQNKKCKIK